MEAVPRKTIFYDDDCGLCNRAVQFILKRKGAKHFRFAPLYGNTYQAIKTNFNFLALDSIVYYSGKDLQYRSSAVIAILYQLGVFWKLCGFLLFIVPKPIRDRAYVIIARNRNKLKGRKKHCLIPSKSEKKLFLD